MSRRIFFIILPCTMLLWVCVSQLNHYLAPLHLNLFAGGLLVTFPALRLGFREGSWVALMAGLLLDASAPVPFGFHGILFVAAHTAIFNLRSRFPREEAVFGVIVAVVANLALFCALSVALLRRSPAPFTMSVRAIGDLIVSQAFIALVAPWFFALQERALDFGGVSLRREQRGLV